MKVLIQVTHPAHVHFYKNLIEEAQNQDHEITVIARDKDVTVDLLEGLGIDYKKYMRSISTDVMHIRRQLRSTKNTYDIANRFGADVMTAIGGTAVSYASLLTDATSLIFTDTEHATLQNSITFPFADRIYTPDCYMNDIGDKHVRYPGYHELAYLHPNQFNPDASVVRRAGINPREKYVILRLVSWDAVHDVGDSGFDDVVEVVEEIEATGTRVLITSEADLPKAVEDRRLTVSPHNIHHLMAYANLFLGESTTMAAESAVLGTPAVCVSSSRRGYTDELEKKYKLVFNYCGLDRQRNGLKRALSILENYDEQLWTNRREIMLEDKIDVTEFLIETILEENQ
ncbi:DUF354 domain-containing protein [Halobacterium salinarum]|uniref:DUF354 domain-containing protein n=1 Tax=Halobacterium salinarum TaxID=2242 RepID=UPI0025535899|nr:DUF354 domain-containing protein [Halobacterium salinarum]MDL0125113.1 DUF354 domain-containing protein [Halobacterium salinarum]